MWRIAGVSRGTWYEVWPLRSLTSERGVICTSYTSKVMQWLKNIICVVLSAVGFFFFPPPSVCGVLNYPPEAAVPPSVTALVSFSLLGNSCAILWDVLELRVLEASCYWCPECHKLHIISGEWVFFFILVTLKAVQNCSKWCLQHAICFAKEKKRE